MNIDDEFLKLKLKSYRRVIHANPEKGWMEYCTASYISRELNCFGFEMKRGSELMDMSFAMGLPSEEENSVAFSKALEKYSIDELSCFEQNKTAVAGILDLDKDKTIAIRFDMDALPISESTSNEHIPFMNGFVSSNGGVMHACGHDLHVATGLGLAYLLSENINSLNVNVILVFQPAEEGVRGASTIVKSGFLDSVDCVLSTHVWSNMPVGKIVCCQNGTSSTHKFDVVFRGKSSHAGICPEKGNNALLAAALSVVGLHSLVDVFDEEQRINVGRIEGGCARNIVADNCKIELELRSKSIEKEELLKARVVDVIQSAANQQSCSFEIIKQGEAFGARGTDGISNLVENVACDSLFFSDVVFSDEINRGCEDFSTMMNFVKHRGGEACFIGIGAALCDRELSHHSCDFDVSEEVMFPVVKLLYNVICQYDI